MKQWKKENLAQVYNALVFSSQYAKEALNTINAGSLEGVQIELVEIDAIAEAAAEILATTLTIDKSGSLDHISEDLETLNDAEEQYILMAPPAGSELDLCKRTNGNLLPDLLNDPTRKEDFNDEMETIDE